MNENTQLLESLFEKASDYGKTSLELIKLKALDKTTDLVSSLVPHSVVVIFTAIFLLFLNLGLAFFIGDLLGKMFYGFFAVAAFYILTAVSVHFFMHKRIKKLVGDFIIKKVLN